MVVLEKGAAVMVAAAATAVGMYLLAGGPRKTQTARYEDEEAYRFETGVSRVTPQQRQAGNVATSRVKVERVPVDEDSHFLPYEEKIIEEKPSFARGTGRLAEKGDRFAADVERAAGKGAERLEQGLATAEAKVDRFGRRIEADAERAGRKIGETWQDVERRAGRAVDRGEQAMEDVEARLQRGVRRVEAEAKETAEDTRGFFSRMFGGAKPGSGVPSSGATANIYRADLGDPALARFQEGEVIESRRVNSLELRAREEHDAAETARKAAEKAAAEAAAALAAAQTYDAKRREDRARAERAREEARMLEEAAVEKQREAREAESLARKEDKYRTNAEADANKRLAEEDRALKETARYEERSRADHRAAEAERLRMAELRKKDAEDAARAAAAARERAEQEFERERLAADESRRRTAEVERLAREADLAKNRAAQEAAELLAREKELQAQTAEVDRKRREAEARAASATASKDEAARNAAKVRAAVDVHERAAKAAADARARADDLKKKAEETSARATGMVDRLKGWFASEPAEKPVTAISQATGSARSALVTETEDRTGRVQERQVIASGAARVDVKEGMPAGPSGSTRGFTGRENAEIRSDYVAPDLGRAQTRMAETSRDVEGPQPPRTDSVRSQW